MTLLGKVVVRLEKPCCKCSPFLKTVECYRTCERYRMWLVRTGQALDL